MICAVQLCLLRKKKTFQVRLQLLWLPFTQTLSGPVDDPRKLPKWNFDGSSTGQATGDDSEVILWYHAPDSILHLHLNVRALSLKP